MQAEVQVRHRLHRFLRILYLTCRLIDPNNKQIIDVYRAILFGSQSRTAGLQS